MAIVTGGASEVAGVAATAPLPNRSQGLGVARGALNRRDYALIGTTTKEEADTHIDVTPTSGPSPTPALQTGGVAEFIGNGGQQWFEQIHIFPDSIALNPSYLQDKKIEFGNILAQIDREYEIYNASRRSSTTLNTITIAIAPGIETPDVAASAVMSAQTSLLAPASTYNSQLTTGLGTPVRVTLRALREGLSNFDGPVTFDFSLDSVILRASGSRIALLLAEYEFPFSETMSFLTDIIEATSGKEQRIALRKQPREIFNCIFRLDGVDRQRFQAQMFDWHHNNFGLPLWHESVDLAAATVANATQFQTTGASVVDFRVGGLMVVYQDDYTFDVLTIDTVSDTLIETTSGAANGYAAGALILPVRPCRIIGSVNSRLSKYNNLEEFRVTFESIDNDTGTPAGSTTAWNSNTYDGKILLDECNVVQGITVRTQLERRITVLDNETGLASQSSPWDHDKRSHSKGFRADGRAAIQNLKALLRAVRGRQISFYIPTFTSDLTAADDLALGTAILDISRIDYARFVQDREPMATFKITFTDGTSLVRVVQSSGDHPTEATQERLTLDTTWPANRSVSEIANIEFYQQVRFDTDEFRINYDRVGLARMTAPCKVVFD